MTERSLFGISPTVITVQLCASLLYIGLEDRTLDELSKVPFQQKLKEYRSWISAFSLESV